MFFAPINHRFFSTLTAAATVLAVSAGASAAKITWKGPSGGMWETPSNWTGNKVPGPADEAFIPRNSGRVLITDDVQPKNIERLTMENSSGALAAGGAPPTLLTTTRNPWAVAKAIRINTTDGVYVGTLNTIQPGDSGESGDGTLLNPVIGNPGADVTIVDTSAASGVYVARGGRIAGGTGGGKGVHPAGRGGDVSITAVNTVSLTDGRVDGGSAGEGSGACPKGKLARGGDVRITTTFALGAFRADCVSGGVSGGAGRYAGGNIVVRSAFVTLVGAPSIQGGAAGKGRSAAGGTVALIASRTVRCDPHASNFPFPANVSGGAGSDAAPAANPGRGGSVIVAAENVLNGTPTLSWVVRGGNVGTGATAAPVRGGAVTIFASETVQPGTVVAGLGDGGAAGPGDPVGNVLIVGGVINGINSIFGGAVKLGTAFANLLPQDAGGVSLIDLSALPPGSIVASELVCIDAGSAGTIDFLGAATGSISCGGGSGPVDLSGAMVELEGAPDGETLDPSDEAAIQPYITGAISIGPACPGGCVGDFNGDGVVDGADVALFLDAWAAGNAQFDLTDDLKVDGADLAIVLANWGPCS